MARLRKLLVVVPGIGGSVLEAPDGSAAWQLTCGSLGGALVRPGQLAVDYAPQLRAVHLVRSFTALGPLLSLTGYQNLVGSITGFFDRSTVHVHRKGLPVRAGTDVLLFPYDFRRSITEAAAELADAVGQALGDTTPSARVGRVIVVAHSLGGLVARYWAAVAGGHRVCRAIITLGTPHRGAPKALDWLVNGAGVGPLRHPALTGALRTWPSLYELLPQYPAVWNAAAGREVELTVLPDRLELAAYAPRFAAEAARARRVHDDLYTAWQEIPGPAIEVAPYFGRGHPTTNEATLTAEGVLRFTKRDPAWRTNVGWRGDGTVPALCAIPRDLGEDPLSWRELPDRHGALAGTSGFLDLVRSLCGEPLPTRGTNGATQRRMGLDVDDVVPAGLPVPLGAQVYPRPYGVRATVLRGVAPFDVVDRAALEPVGDGWCAELSRLPAGRFTVRVDADVADGKPLTRQADVVALDADAEAQALEADAG
jgi:pimeloyl-ACP methyl ester carboxylesterase